MNGYDMGAWAWAGMALMAVITVAIVALVWVIARRACEPHACVSTAREQLDARLARGEIDSEEYRERLEALSDSRQVARLVVRAGLDVRAGRRGSRHDERRSWRLRRRGWLREP